MEKGLSSDHCRFKVGTIGCGNVAWCDNLKVISAVIELLEIGGIVVW